jgi:uncharacterized membrane protein (UPF0136 family)
MKFIITISLLLFFFTSSAQIERLAGPRFGITYLTPGSAADIFNEGIDFDENEFRGHGNTGSSLTTQYGWQWESRFADGGGNIIGIVEWVILVAGLEKGFFLPSASSLVGVRNSKGLEFAIGPNVSLSGVGMAFALGYNIKSGNLNIPINLAFVPGIKKEGQYRDEISNQKYEYDYSTGSRVSLLIGFNMNKKNR